MIISADSPRYHEEPGSISVNVEGLSPGQIDVDVRGAEMPMFVGAVRLEEGAREYGDLLLARSGNVTLEGLWPGEWFVVLAGSGWAFSCHASLVTSCQTTYIDVEVGLISGAVSLKSNRGAIPESAILTAWGPLLENGYPAVDHPIRMRPTSGGDRWTIRSGEGQYILVAESEASRYYGEFTLPIVEPVVLLEPLNNQREMELTKRLQAMWD
jgi:hypothetical protein